MAVYTHVSAEALAGFLARYDVGELVSAKGIAEGVENSNYLVDTTAGRFILTLYEKRVAAGDLPYFLSLLDHLAAKRLPVPPAIKDRAGVAIQELAGRPACLIKFLPGVSVTHPTTALAHATGAVLGDMHAHLLDFTTSRPNTLGYRSWRPLLDRCGHSLDQIRSGLHDEITELLGIIDVEWPTALPIGTIHADLFPDNVLVLDADVTGVIDFYFACSDFRAYDLAITHSAWSFGADGRHFSAAIGHAIVEGYASRMRLSEEERFALPTLAAGACLRFSLTRAWDWLNTPADALVTRKDPLAYLNRAYTYLALRDAAFA